MSTLESALTEAVRWLLGALVLTPALLAFDSGERYLAVSVIHLSVVVAIVYAFTVRLAGLADRPMFDGVRSERRRLFIAAAALTAIATGLAALVTLASAAALRFDPSLQFLQLLSALDIAWVVAASTLGFRWLLGAAAGQTLGAIIAVVCVWSIWRYLDEVGFGPDGQWIVDGDALARLVLPFDVMAAVVAIAAAVLGARRQATAQPSPQS